MLGAFRLRKGKGAQPTINESPSALNPMLPAEPSRAGAKLWVGLVCAALTGALLLSWVAPGAFAPPLVSLRGGAPPSAPFGSHIAVPGNAAAAAAAASRAPPEEWLDRTQPFVNVFLIWSTHRDMWGALQDRVLGSIVGSVHGARVRVLSNTLPVDSFDALAREGYDVAVMRYDLPALLRGAGGGDELPGAMWLAAMQAARGPHEATHTADFLRLVALARYGGLYLDTDALLVRDVSDLPAAFVGKIDFLKLEPVCSWCIDGRWYLANGVMSFPARHGFLSGMLRAIDVTPYDHLSRTTIGPRFLTVEVATSGVAERGELALLSEWVLYPIPGPHIPLYSVPHNRARSSALAMLGYAHSIHTFAYTFGRLAVHEDSVMRHLLRAFWPASRPALCFCAPSVVAPSLCLPASVIISLVPAASSEFVAPVARLCVRVTAAAAAMLQLRDGHFDLTVTARNGVISSWGLPAARSHTLTLAAPTWTTDELESLTYRHLGDYCNDVITLTITQRSWRGSAVESATVPVSAPCLTSLELASAEPRLPSDLRAAFPVSWADEIGEPLSSLTTADLEDDPELAANFSACTRYGSRSALQAAAAVTEAATAGLVEAPVFSPEAPLRVGLLVSATGTYISWLDGLILSAEQHFFSKGNTEVHYFVLSDLSELPAGFGPAGRIHLLHQPRLGWPFDSMFRHHMYLQHRAS